MIPEKIYLSSDLTVCSVTPVLSKFLEESSVLYESNIYSFKKQCLHLSNIINFYQFYRSWGLFGRDLRCVYI